MKKIIFNVGVIISLIFINGCIFKKKKHKDSDNSSFSVSDKNVSTNAPNFNPVDSNITSNTNDNVLKEGILKFKVINPNSKLLMKYTYEANGDLIATPDKLENAINSAIEINKEYIKQINNVYEIAMPQTANAAVAVFSYDKQYGLVLSEKSVKNGKVTDLGSIELLPTKTLKLRINSLSAEIVGLKMNLIGIDKSVSTNSDIIIENVPQGKHLITITKYGRPIVSKYVEVKDNTNVEINLTNYNPLKLTGIILDENGKPLDSAVVFLKPTNDNYLIQLTDEKGRFEFDNLMMGNFTLIVKKSGYKALKKENIEINYNDINLGNLILKKDVNTGSIAGYAYFNDSKQHAGIDITIEKIGGGYETNQVGTLPDGAFLITNLPEGNYTLHFGKSADSEYSQEDIKNIEVVKGTTKILEKPVVLKHLLAYISGIIKFPSNFTNKDLANISIKACDNETGKCYPYNVTSLDQNNSAEINLSVPSNHSYTFTINGKDAEGNDISPITETISTLSTGENFKFDNILNVTYVDPNPPVINSVIVTKVLGVLKKLGDNTYIVNPTDKIKLDVTAQDRDGDNITYNFSCDEGTLSDINEKSGTAIYEAPNEGGEYTITVTASDGKRSDNKTIIIKVNHYPLIQLISPQDITDKNNPKQYEASDLVTINTDISDAEDAEDNLSIRWFSSLQGEIEQNTTNLNKILIPGTHTITVYAKDSLGLVSSKQFFIKVNPQKTVWLRTPNTYIKRFSTSEGIVLNDSYKIPISSNDYHLLYKSNDTNVVIVNELGVIQAVNAGSAKVTVYSEETDENGKPLYSFDIYVRVVGDITQQNSTPYHIKPGQIYQIRVNKDNEPDIILDTDTPGNYEFLTFDNHDVVTGSYSCVTYYVNNISNEKKCGVGNAIFNIDVYDVDNEYKMHLSPYDSSYDEYVKVALLPSSNVIKNNKTLPSFFFDDDNEFNDISPLSKKVNLYEATISDVHTRALDYDTKDYYYIDIQNLGEYGILFQTLKGTQPNTFHYIKILSPSGTEILNKYLSDYSASELFGWYTFLAKERGKYKILIYNNGGFGDATYYQFNIYPSTENGLIQDEEGEINDIKSMATPITLEKVEKGIKGKVNVRKTDIADWYEINLKAGTYVLTFQTLTGTSSSGYKYITISNSTVNYSVSHYLYDYSKGEGLYGQYILNIPEDGKYKIKIYNDNSAVTYYKFSLRKED